MANKSAAQTVAAPKKRTAKTGKTESVKPTAHGRKAGTIKPQISGPANTGGGNGT